MALKKPTTGTTPAFEADPAEAGGAAVAEAPAAAPPAAAPAVAEARAAEQASTAIAVAATPGGLTTNSKHEAAAAAKAFQKEVEAMQGASDFSYGNYRQFKGNNGTIAETSGDKADLGRWIKIRMISWDDHHEISPGEQGASTKDFVAYSKDGKVIDQVIGDEYKSWIGKSTAEYIAYLQKEEDFDNAKSRRFIDVAGALLDCENNDEDAVGQVIQITLSESSIPAFKKYQQALNDTARCVAMGIPGFKLPEDPFTFFMIRELAEKGNNKWTKLRMAQNLPAKI